MKYKITPMNPFTAPAGTLPVFEYEDAKVEARRMLEPYCEEKQGDRIAFLRQPKGLIHAVVLAGGDGEPTDDYCIICPVGGM